MILKKRQIIPLFLTLIGAFNFFVYAQKSFEFVVLPDTQTYMEKFPEIYMKQMEWIANQGDRFSFVLHVGDVTQNNSENEWEIAKAGFSLLNGKIPYNISLGNHDMGSGPENLQILEIPHLRMFFFL